MGWRFFRRVQILPGVRVNLSRSGPSLSFGRRGLVTTLSRRGRRTTVGIPGTGLSYSTTHPWEFKASTGGPCSVCGFPGRSSAKFCGKCGAKR